MNERLTEEKIRATIGEMLTSDLFKGVNTEANRDQIIAMLWNWVSEFCLDPINNPQRILVLLQDIYGDIPMEVEMDGLFSRTKYLKLHLPNSTWYITKDAYSYTISSTLPMAEVAFKDSEKTAEYIRIFDQTMPKIREWIEEKLEEIEKDRLVCKILTNSAKELAEQVINEAKIKSELLFVKGSIDGSIMIYFKDKTELHCTLETLRDKMLQLFS